MQFLVMKKNIKDIELQQKEQVQADESCRKLHTETCMWVENDKYSQQLHSRTR